MKPGVDFTGVGCGALVVNDNHEVLLILRGEGCRNDHGLWSQPGGRVRFGESIYDAVNRELKEELGIEVELIEPLQVVDHMIDEQHWVSPVYMVKIVSGEPQNLEPHKHDEVCWFGIQELPENLNENTKKSTEEYKKRFL